VTLRVRPRRVRHGLLVLAVALGMLVLTPSPSWACSCAMATTPVHVEQAVTVASGTVDWTATDGQTRTYNVVFDAVYKGAAAQSEKLLTGADDASCGLGDLATDQRYLFFIDGKHPGTMRVGLCGGTVAYDDAIAHQVESITGPPGKPLPAPVLGPSTDDSGSRATLVAGTAAGALVLLAVVAVVLRRRAA
jgi:hypothetical protein